MGKKSFKKKEKNQSAEFKIIHDLLNFKSCALFFLQPALEYDCSDFLWCGIIFVSFLGDFFKDCFNLMNFSFLLAFFYFSCLEFWSSSSLYFFSF